MMFQMIDPKPPLSITLRLDPEDAEMVRRLTRSMGGKNFQNTIVQALREFEQRHGSTQEWSSEQLSYRDRYFALLEGLSGYRDDVEKRSRQLLAELDQMQEMAGLKPPKKRRKK